MAGEAFSDGLSIDPRSLKAQEGDVTDTRAFDDETFADQGLAFYEQQLSGDDILENAERPLFTKQERESSLWAKLKLHLQLDLKELREENDNDLDPIETAKLRGRILSIKEFLSLGEPVSGSDSDSLDQVVY